MIDKQSESGNTPGPAAGPGGASPITFRLDPRSGVPTYRQLVHQVEQALRLGHLQQGDRLPTVKEAVAALAINPNTVLKAYRELEHRGLVAGRPGQGTFVQGTLRRVGPAEQAALRTTLLAWLRAAAGAGLDDESISALFVGTLRDFRDDGAAAVRPGSAARRSTRGVA